MDREIDKQNRQNGGQIDKVVDGQIERLIDRQKGWQINKWKDRQMERQKG